MFSFFFAVFVFSFLLCMILVLTKSWHGRFSMDGNHGIQKLHLNPVPRIGGFGLAAAVWLFWVLSYFGHIDWYAKNPGSDLLLIILIAGLPALLFGLAEDVTKRVGVLARFLATFASGLLAWWFTGYALSSVDVPGFDWLLQWGLISVIFTAFAVTGVANSLNIIDGLNGLAGSTATWAFLAYGIMAFVVGDLPLASVSLLMAAGVFGFLGSMPFCVELDNIKGTGVRVGHWSAAMPVAAG